MFSWAPTEIVGSRPGCEAGTIWWRLACIIEEGFYHDGQDISGLSCDLSKCFNTLPRVPVFWLARRLGIPSYIVLTWHRAVANMTRRFQVLGKTGPPLGSCCGFPEGDPLSVVGSFVVLPSTKLHFPLSVTFWPLTLTDTNQDRVDCSFNAFTSWLGHGWVMVIYVTMMVFIFHVVHCPFQLLKQRACEAWQNMVGSELSTRDGFEGLDKCNFSLTTERLSHYSFEQLGLLRVVLNGTFFTRDKQIHSGHFVDRACPWCSEPCDSIFHRHWECPHFQSSRGEVPTHIFQQLEELPDCSLQHGWFCTSSLLPQFRSCLQDAPDLTADFNVDPVSQDVLHLFIDGSCLNPTCPFTRIASWGVVCADIGQDCYRDQCGASIRQCLGLNVWQPFLPLSLASCRLSLSGFGLITNMCSTSLSHCGWVIL